MNLDKYINISLIKLSKKYDISIVQVMSVYEQHVSRKYTVNYKPKKSKKSVEEEKASIREVFFNKRELVKCLMRLNKSD